MAYRVYDPAREAIVSIDDLPSVRAAGDERGRQRIGDSLTDAWVRLYFRRHEILELAWS